ncbi:hypothetical protein RTI28_23370 [Pseudomonas sp. zfem002]|nr:hypothetical protein [Pseudomonas sp. zfem002]MDU9393552.1 hypothetical protein [Pseudomonas sp. zfem002]
MGIHNKNLIHLMLVGCTLGASLLAAQAQAQPEGNGVVVLTRDVKVRPAIRSNHPDPYPLTVNTNASARITAQTSNELSDGDFASVASGATVNRVLLPDASNGVRGVNAVPSTLPGMGNIGGGGTGGGAGAGAGISNRVGSAIGAGLAPLQILTGNK